MNGCVRILSKEPLRVDLHHVGLEWLVDSDINQLHETGAAGRDNPKLDAKTLDGVGNAAKENESRNRMGMIPLGAVVTYGARTFSTQSSMVSSSNYALSCNV